MTGGRRRRRAAGWPAQPPPTRQGCLVLAARQHHGRTCAFKDAVYQRVSLRAKKPVLFREGGVRGRGNFFETRSLLWYTQVFGGWRTAACSIASSLHQWARGDQRGLFSWAWCAPAAQRQWLPLPPYGPSTSSGSRAPPLRRHPRSVYPLRRSAVSCRGSQGLQGDEIRWSG